MKCVVLKEIRITVVKTKRNRATGFMDTIVRVEIIDNEGKRPYGVLENCVTRDGTLTVVLP